MQKLGSLLAAAGQIGMNWQRVKHGERVLARAHLPFNTKERAFGPETVDSVATAAAAAGLGRGHVHALRDYLYRTGRRPDPDRKEAFMLAFNDARQRARDRIFEAMPPGAARTAFDLYETICVNCGRGSPESAATRRQLARECYLTERAVTRITRRLAKLDLVRLDQDGRGVRYVVLPVDDLGYPLWNGDRASRLDAAGEARLRLERERQAELTLS